MKLREDEVKCCQMDRTLMETEKQETNEKRQQLKFKSENIGLDP